MNLEFIKPQNFGSLFMKSGQSNLNLRSPGSYLVCSYLITIERTYICETSSFGRKVSRRKAVLLLGFSCSVAFYNKTMGFFNRLILYQINYEGFKYLVNNFKGLPTFFQWFMALSSWKNGVVFVLHTIQGIKFR